MGSRMMRKWIDYPLIDRNEIENRLDYTTLFLNDFILRKDIEECLKTVYDLERIVGSPDFDVGKDFDYKRLFA